MITTKIKNIFYKIRDDDNKVDMVELIYDKESHINLSNEQILQPPPPPPPPPLDQTKTI